MVGVPPLPFSSDRLTKALELYEKERILRMEKLKAANSKEEIDVAANAVAALLTQADHFYSSRFWQEAATAEEAPRAEQEAESKPRKP